MFATELEQLPEEIEKTFPDKIRQIRAFYFQKTSSKPTINKDKTQND